MSVLVFIILYTFEPFDEWAQYGARYYYPTLGAIAILVAFGLNRLGNILPRYLLFAIITISLGYQLMNVRHDLKDYSSRFDFVETITKDIHQHCPGHSIVIIKDPHFYFDASTFTSWSDFHRNFIPSESRFFVYNKQEANLLNKSYPSYGVCEYNFSNNGSIN